MLSLRGLDYAARISCMKQPSYKSDCIHSFVNISLPCEGLQCYAYYSTISAKNIWNQQGDIWSIATKNKTNKK